MEWVGPSKRMLVGLVIHLIGPTGELYMLAVACFVRTWNWIIIAMVVPIGLFTVLWWYVFNIIEYFAVCNFSIYLSDETESVLNEPHRWLGNKNIVNIGLLPTGIKTFAEDGRPFVCVGC